MVEPVDVIWSVGSAPHNNKFGEPWLLALFPPCVIKPLESMRSLSVAAVANLKKSVAPLPNASTWWYSIKPLYFVSPVDPSAKYILPIPVVAERIVIPALAASAIVKLSA